MNTGGSRFGGARAGGRRLPARLPILVALGTDALGSGLFLPISLLYFTAVAGLPLGTVGTALSVAVACSLPVPLLAGACADRFGARRVVVTAQLLQALGFCGYLFVRDAATLFAAVLLVGLGERAFWATVYTFVADTVAVGDLDAWYARVSVTRNAGLGAGSLLAGVVLGAGGRGPYQVAVIANGVSFLVAAALLALFVREIREIRPATARTQAPEGGYRDILRDRPFLAFTAINVVFSLCLTITTVALPIYVVEGLSGPGWLTGVLFAVNTGSIIVVQGRVTRAVASHRRTRVLSAAGALWVAWALAMAAGPQILHGALIPYLIAAVLLFTVAEMMQSPTSTALAAVAGPDAMQGRYMAVYQYGYQIAKIIAPTLFAQLFVFRPVLPWLAVAVLAGCAAIAVLKLEKHLPDRAVHRGTPQERTGLTRA